MNDEELTLLFNDSPVAEHAREGLSTPLTKRQKQIQRLQAEETAGRSRNYLYYQEIKKTDRDKYLSPAIQKQMEQDAIDNQETFMNGVSDD